MGELPNAPIHGPHVPQTEALQIGDHRFSISCAVVERPGLIAIVVMTLFNIVLLALSWLSVFAPV